MTARAVTTAPKIASEARQYVTLTDAAERLACSERTLRRMIAAGELTGYRIGKRLVRLDAAELDALARVIPAPHPTHENGRSAR